MPLGPLRGPCIVRRFCEELPTRSASKEASRPSKSLIHYTRISATGPFAQTCPGTPQRTPHSSPGPWSTFSFSITRNNKRSASKVEIGRINKRIAAAEDEEEVARRRYDEFRDAHGIADLSTEQRSMLESAAKLRADSELAGSEVRALEAQVKSLGTQLASTPQTRVVIGGVSLNALPISGCVKNWQRQGLRSSENHPRVQSLQQQVDRLRAGGTGTSGGDGQLAANTTYQAIGQQLRTAKSNLEALRERQRGLIELAEKAQQRVEAFRTSRAKRLAC